MTLLDMVFRGGWVMIPIAVCSLLALFVVIERWITLNRLRTNTRMFVLQLKNLLLKNQAGEAITLCKKTPGPIAKIARAGLERMSRPRQEIKEAIESAGKTEVYHLEKYLGMLATVASVAPALGFLGTVTGMIQAFMQVQQLGGNVDASVLAGGIWEALITTAAGLIVGIPAIICYNWIVGKVERFVFEMEEASTELLDTVLRGEKEGVRAFANQ